MEEQNRAADATEEVQVEVEVEMETGPAGPETLVRADLQAGEKVFTVILFAVGVFFFIQSLLLLQRVDGPKIASAAALPLFVSGIWTLFSLITLIENIRKTTPVSRAAPASAAFKKALRYAFPQPVLVLLGAILVYCVTLLLGISFYIVTPLFLWGSMCYLTRKDYVKNILWTAICMAFIVLVFRMLFGVVMP